MIRKGVAGGAVRHCGPSTFSRPNVFDEVT